ncbi:MAG TPA: 16S rRNA (adenine(1518)-N(6)/adenine(1519)-N(6))-dimethyltransferase RsmA [Gemmatimonadaceae bacterium]|nr:16S rRNA (adenine(1518)-N(6)/adenine(1519)-N(6))-dimethyltransferase RsmA [Gemmatimonadaceae bacterium]
MAREGEGTGAGSPRRKRFGQHFLTDSGILGRIAEAAGVGPGSTVVEIGPGRGSLTAHLLETGARVVAVEIDRDLVRRLQDRFAGVDRLTIIQGDVLDTDLAAAAGGDYALAGNIPYNITTPILFHAMRPPRPRCAVFLLQREVGERMGAAPGSRIYGALTVTLAAVAHTEVLFRVPPGAFQPPPKVDSVVVRLTPRADPLVSPREEEAFRVLVQGAFGLRRKQMRRVVRTLFDLDADTANSRLAAACIDPGARPETLAPEAFAALLRSGSTFPS